ncbi:MAG: LysR family transcriptional regulator [Myxococcota bacterium]
MLENLRLLVSIVEKGGMAAAGREWGLSPATVSARLAALEEHYGTRLIHRTTRSLSLTSEGAVLLEGARQIIAEMDDLEARVRLGAERLFGTMRITGPVDLGRGWLVPRLDAFLAKHPHLKLELQLSDGYVDLSRFGFDLALRYGTLSDSTLRVRKLTTVRRMACASPSYIEKNGTPQTPEDLAHHNCLVMRFGGEPDHHWPFKVDGKEVRISASGNRVANDGDLVRRWCLDGHGIALKSDLDIRADLDAGRLVPILTAFEADPTELQLVYPGGRSPSRRIRALIEHIVAARDELNAHQASPNSTQSSSKTRR